MYDFNKVVQNCLLKCDETNIKYGIIKGFTLFNEGRDYLGICKTVNCDEYTIEISSMLLDEQIPIEILESVILHEILHTCIGCFNHGKTWRQEAQKINSKYGYNISRRGNIQIKDLNLMGGRYKYVVRCKSCGKLYGYQRMSKALKNLNDYECPICKGELERVK